ncbi:hypothetical protein HfxHF1_180 [Halophage HF1]|uniref:Uncharacterized protein n=2 Tax=Haloferacalesvirus TaxID=2843389 RepID=Q8V6T1_9CAUD|nr:hypothetical protein HrrHF2_180 [Halorubrum phage HF2]NP_861611.2 hypothetical protein HfxHF1_180 [Halophage HF1]AAL54945.2 hypothetical protein HrrHF2_180 [Halorubrum phage HF2]AAO61322.2 hypothetical protein HfxHF1_180 [Halophage HF1]QIR31132.1 hypothetical protein HrrHc2_480 [Halorubrum virus Hardycor2]
MSELREILNDVLREMYAEAEPPLDFDEVLENPDEYGSGWYADHYLDGDRQTEIVEKYAEKHELNRSQRKTLSFSAILSYGPSSTSRKGVEA